MAVALERSATLSALAPETRCLYDIYKKEGDDLYCKRRYKKALLSYNEALRLVQRNTQTLVARSRCYMGIGLMQKALDDAESALTINASYLPAIYQKAQIHYRQGNYEMALLTYNRGHKLNSSAPGFLEGMQKAQHAMDIMTTGRHMKTTAVGDLSLYLPKKQSSFQVSKKSLPTLPALKGKDQRVPSPGFRKRTGTLLLQVQKRRPSYLEQPRYGRGDLENTKVNHKAMREILGQLYDDKEYFERILSSAGGQRDLSEMLSSVLEDGLKFLYDRVLFWAQSGRLPPAPPQPTNIQAIQWPITRVEEESSNEETEEEEETDDEMVKVNDAIDAVSSVNGPNSTTRRKRLKVRKRRADILKKRASVIVIPKKKSKKIQFRKVEEAEPEEEHKDASKIHFRFNSLPAISGASPPDTRLDLGADGRSDRGMTTYDESEADSGVVAVDDLDEKRRRKEERRKQRREEREKRREEERQRKIKEVEEAKEQKTPKEDPLIEYLNKMMDSLEELFQKSEYSSLKTKAESFLLTMEKYDKNVTEHKMSYVGKAHSYLGNAYIGLRNYDFAMMHHDKDLEIGERWKLPECVSRALGNIGRVYISRKKFDQALKYLAQKTKMPSSPRETAWLYHEIASCFLQLHHYQFAKDAACKSLEAAAHSNDSLYQLQTSVLLGAIEVKLQKFEKAYGSFERAMDQARLRDDKKAQQAIAEALQEVNERIAREARRKQTQREAAKEAPVATALLENEAKQGQANGNNEEGRNVSVSESARDTGEDPELTDLVTDDDTASEGTRDGKEKKGNERSGQPDKKNNVVEKEENGANEPKNAEGVASDAKEEELTKVEKENKTGNEREETVKEGENGEDKMETANDKGSENDTSEKEATAGGNGEKDDATDRGQEGEENVATNDKEALKENQANDESQDTTGENKDDPTKATDPETKDEEQAETKDENGIVKNEAGPVETGTSAESENATSEEKEEKSMKTKDGKDEESKTTSEQGKGEQNDNTDENNQNDVSSSKESDEKVKNESTEKQDKETVAVVVTEAEEVKMTSGENAEDGSATTDNTGKSVGSPEATYKEVPITQELLTKNLAQDRGMKENVRKSVVSIHESVRESESRRSSAKVPRDIQSSTKKSVTIGGEQEMGDDKKEEKSEEVKTKAEEKEEEPEPTEPRGKDPIADRMEDDLAHMEKDYTEKNFDQLLKRGNDLMRALKKVRNIDSWSKRRLRNFSKVHSFMGSASSEKQNFDKARMHHNADLKIGEVVENTKIQSRALEHLGRTFIFEGKHEKALEFFAKRAHLPRTTEETARLFHEIANCFFQLKAYEFAKDAAMVSMKAANEGNHTMFQLQSAVLIGVTKVKLQRTDAAFETFEEALKYAVIRDDPQAAEAIRQAMRQIEAKVALKVKDQWMKKVKSSKDATQDENVEEEKEKQSQIPEKDSQSRTGAESDSNVYSLLNSMQEEDKPVDETGATTTNHDTNQEGKEDTNIGSENIDTNRTDKSGFLLAPDGPIDKKQNTDRIVKVEKEANNTTKQANKQTTKKVSKKSTAGSIVSVDRDKGKGKSSNPNTNKASNTKTTASTNTKATTLANSKAKDNPVTISRKREETKDTVKAETSVKTVVSNSAKGCDDSSADDASSEEPQVIEAATQNQELEHNSADTEKSVNRESKSKEVSESQNNQAQKDDKNPDSTPKEIENTEKADSTEVEAVKNGIHKDNTVNKENESESAETERNKSLDETIAEKGNVNAEQTHNHETANDNAGVENKETVTAPSNPTTINPEDTPKAAVKSSPRKAKPKPQATEEEKSPPMERRKSERFVGLDPKKVAEFKNNNKSPKSIQEEGPDKDQATTKPKTERFVGLKPKKEKKPEKPIGDGSEQGSPKLDGVSVENDAKTKEEHGGKKTSQINERVSDEKETEIKSKSRNQSCKDAIPKLTAPIVSPPENSSSPKKANTSNVSPSKTEQTDATDPNNDDGYETNVPNAPMLTINDEVGFVRRDSIASKISGPRPATRMSLADMVKSDTKEQDKNTPRSSKEELSALNALVKEAIKIDKKELRKAKEQSSMTSKDSPRKASRLKASNVVSLNEHKLEEMRREAEIKRARRKRFLRNWKASFLLMLNSPYAEIPTIQGRRLSTDFKHYRRNMSKANLSLAINEEGTYYQNFEDLEIQRGYKTSPRKSYGEKTSYSPEKALKRRAGRGRSVNEDEDDILGHIEEQLTSQDETKAKKSKTSEEARIASDLAKAARDMRRKERDERREERKRLEEAERQRRIEEREEKDLLASMATKVSFSNPYDKSPTQIPKLEQRSSLGDDDEKRWMAHHERKLLRAKRRERREKELKRRHDDEKTKKRLETAAAKSKAGSKAVSKESSPREPAEEDREPQDQSFVEQEETPEETPELYTPEESEPKVDDSEEVKDQPEDKQMEKEEEREEKKAEKEATVEKKEEVAVPTQETSKEKADEKQEEEKEVEVTEKKQPEEEPVKREEKEEEVGEMGEKNVGEEAEDDAEADDFDGYNDSEEDDDDLVAIYIEKEVRKMRADYNDDKIKEVTDRGNALLKALRKHTDIVSWSRRRLRWFAAAHSYMGSANVELKEFQKAQSHHQADYRIGEALEDTKIQSRALEHLARVSVLNQNTPKALEYLAKRAHLPRDSEQSARLFHEMANCFFTLGAVEYARDAAAESIEAAGEGNHRSYLLQSSLLLAVCSSRLKNYETAEEQFKGALTHARRLNDKNTEEAIHAALKEVERKRANMAKDKWKSKIKKGNENNEAKKEVKEG